jgi:small-conductance mechanosensitive channel
MVIRSLQLFYWGITGFVIASLVAPDLLGKLFLGVTMFTAALALALKDIATDFVSGTLMQLTRRFNVGDNVQMIGVDVKGKVSDIGYLSTRITTSEGVSIVPNRNMWGNSVKILKPVRSIILPPGYQPAAPEKEEADGIEIKTPKLFRLFTGDHK